MLLALTGCVTTLPKDPDKPISYSQPPATEGRLAATSQAVLAQADPAESAFLLINNNEQALRWRLALIDSAQQSIDMQVYIWSNDESGRLFLDRIRAAAQRGVRVRLLLDDMPKGWRDRGTAIIARQPNIQMRRFNPGRFRKGPLVRTIQMSLQFKELNRRMHNKQMVVDGRWGIIGGRNIGNPYFGLSTKYNNRDLDVLITGPVLEKMASDFDEFWNSDAAYPGEAMARDYSQQEVQKVIQEFDAVLLKDRQLLKQTRIPTEPENWSREFARLPEEMVTGEAFYFQDSPFVKGDRGIRLNEQLKQLDLNVRHQSCIITPYLIPSKEQLQTTARVIKEENRRVRVLAPSMASNNHTIVHSHYRKYRKRLLKMGVELYEFRSQPSDALRSDSDTFPVHSKFISLHTKAFIFDQDWVLLGSLNLDPRSIEINTENLLMVESAELAKQLLADFETMCAPENAWAVTLNEKNKLRWTSEEGERSHQPGRSSVQRFFDLFYGLLPVEGQL